MESLPQDMARAAAYRDQLEQGLLRCISGVRMIGEENDRLPNTLNITFEDLEADEMLMLLDHACIAALSGSACAAGSMEPSHVLRAMNATFVFLRGVVHLSLSRETPEQDIDRVPKVPPQIVQQLRSTAIPMEAAYEECR
jgi:cysteine desulfurase